MVYSAATFANVHNCCGGAVIGPPPVAVPDFENIVRCAPTGESVLVITGISASGVPTPVAYKLDGTPYPGALTALVECDTPDIESDAQVMCDGGVTQFIRWFVKRNGVATGSADTNLSGAPYVSVGAVTLGDCGNVLSPKKLYTTAIINGTLTMNNIVTATSASVIHAVSVVQVRGTGKIVGDIGGGFPLYETESHEFSATTLGMESLDLSALVFNAGTGEQHITAIYTV